jgi:outer membrane protein OmpA-like peptidoglycan-associated protein
MSGMPGKRALGALSACLLPLATVLAAPPEPSAPELVKRQAIIRQLASPREDHRGLVQVEDARPVEPQPAAAAGGEARPPVMAFRSIEFALGSAELTPGAKAQLRELAAALASEELRGFRFEISGHADAKGSPGDNRALSERRAAVVKAYLVQAAGIEPSRLEAVGRGIEVPSRPDDPYAAENRRVEIRNLGGTR